MYVLVSNNFEEIKSFLENLKFVKANQNYLDVNPVTNSQDKINELKPLNLKTLNLESKALQMNNNIDELLKSYNETISIVNEKFEMFEKLISNLEKSN